jgi:hypothetical protein
MSWSRSAGSRPVPSPGGVDRGVTKPGLATVSSPLETDGRTELLKVLEWDGAATRHPWQPGGLEVFAYRRATYCRLSARRLRWAWTQSAWAALVRELPWELEAAGTIA